MKASLEPRVCCWSFLSESRAREITRNFYIKYNYYSYAQMYWYYIIYWLEYACHKCNIYLPHAACLWLIIRITSTKHCCWQHFWNMITLSRIRQNCAERMNFVRIMLIEALEIFFIAQVWVLGDAHYLSIYGAQSKYSYTYIQYRYIHHRLFWKNYTNDINFFSSGSWSMGSWSHIGSWRIIQRVWKLMRLRILTATLLFWSDFDEIFWSMIAMN